MMKIVTIMRGWETMLT